MEGKRVERGGRKRGSGSESQREGRVDFKWPARPLDRLKS